ncbi:hypothetical protein HDU98_004868 [Podochytrium sp. JEL0797]|nr:hypothetical protein HDU98_004868 [Podochytrium sp. JEL0797]
MGNNSTKQLDSEETPAEIPPPRSSPRTNRSFESHSVKDKSPSKSPSKSPRANNPPRSPTKDSSVAEPAIEPRNSPRKSPAKRAKVASEEESSREQISPAVSQDEKTSPARRGRSERGASEVDEVAVSTAVATNVIGGEGESEPTPVATRRSPARRAVGVDASVEADPSVEVEEGVGKETRSPSKRANSASIEESPLINTSPTANTSPTRRGRSARGTSDVTGAEEVSEPTRKSPARHAVDVSVEADAIVEVEGAGESAETRSPVKRGTKKPEVPLEESDVTKNRNDEDASEETSPPTRNLRAQRKKVDADVAVDANANDEPIDTPARRTTPARRAAASKKTVIDVVDASNDAIPVADSEPSAAETPSAPAKKPPAKRAPRKKAAVVSDEVAAEGDAMAIDAEPVDTPAPAKKTPAKRAPRKNAVVADAVIADSIDGDGESAAIPVDGEPSETPAESVKKTPAKRSYKKKAVVFEAEGEGSDAMQVDSESVVTTPAAPAKKTPAKRGRPRKKAVVEEEGEGGPSGVVSAVVGVEPGESGDIASNPAVVGVEVGEAGGSVSTPAVVVEAEGGGSDAMHVDSESAVVTPAASAKKTPAKRGPKAKAVVEDAGEGGPSRVVPVVVGVEAGESGSIASTPAVVVEREGGSASTPAVVEEPKDASATVGKTPAEPKSVVGEAASTEEGGAGSTDATPVDSEAPVKKTPAKRSHHKKKPPTDESGDATPSGSAVKKTPAKRAPKKKPATEEPAGPNDDATPSDPTPKKTPAKRAPKKKPATEESADLNSDATPAKKTPAKRTPKRKATDTDGTPAPKRKRAPQTSGLSQKREGALSSTYRKYPHLEINPHFGFLNQDQPPHTISTPTFPSLRPHVSAFTPVTQLEAVDYVSPHASRTVANYSHHTKDDVTQTTLPLFTATRCLRGDLDRTKFVLNTGGSVWALDWAKLEDAECQYLAVAGYRLNAESHQFLGEKQDRELKNCVQIWRVDTNDEDGDAGGGVPVLEMCLLVECGAVYTLEWGGATYFEEVDDFREAERDGSVGNGHVARLGLLAVSFGDGTCRILNVPHPSALKAALNRPLDEPLFVKHDHFLHTFSLPDTLLWKISWGGPNFLATGCSNGNIALWDVRSVLQNHEKTASETSTGESTASSDPTLCFPAHNTAVSKIYWNDTKLTGSEDEGLATQVMSAGYDGQMLLVDVRDAFNPMQLYKIRGIMQAMCQIPHLNAFLAVDTDQTVRYFRPCGGEDEPIAKKSDRLLPTGSEGDSQFKSIGVAGHMSCIWDVEVSPYFPYVATAGADGCCKISNLNRTMTKSYKPAQSNCYQLGYDEETHVFTFVEDTPDERVGDIVKKGESPTLLFSPEISIQKVKYNTNFGSVKWLASGGTAGLVRVENVFNNLIKDKKKR